MESPFDVLGVDPDADEAAVDRAYRRRVKEAHPDQGGSAAAFHRVRAAYEAIEAGDIETTPDAVDDPRDVDEDGDFESEKPEGREVEYLNYDVLADHGWEIDDDDLFEAAAAANLDPADHGRLTVEGDESLLEAAEDHGFAWPFACRGGACANCAVAVIDGDLDLPGDHVLPAEETDRGIRLSCVGAPTAGGTKVVYNVKNLPRLDELILPPHPFERAHADD